MIEDLVDLVRSSSEDAAQKVLDALEGACGHLLPAERSLSRFVTDNELAWFSGRPAPEYR